MSSQHRETVEGLVFFDEDVGAFLQVLNEDPEDESPLLLHCGALVPGELQGKRVRVTIEEIQVDDTPPS